jgi:cysteinyl-tRNA synthetase
MSTAHLGETFDLHGGGRDLVFPHHENEIAQSEGASGVTCARYWTHNGFVNIDDEKMGKSLGNAFNIADLFERYEPQVVRWFLLSAAQYRAPINFTDVLLDEAACRVAYLYESARRAAAFVAENDEMFDGPPPGAEITESLVRRFKEGLDDDFNMPRALDPCLEAFRVLNELLDTRKAKAKPAAARGVARLMKQIRKIDEVLNILSRDPDEYLAAHRAKAAIRHEIALEWVAERIEARKAAREAKDWAAADAVRDELQNAGVILMDRADCTDWSVNDLATGPCE